MSWVLCAALVALRKQINEYAPNRSIESDGTIGDAAHSARRSDHNPDDDHTVNALDVTHDPQGGIDCNLLVDQLVTSNDPRIRYIIWNGRIWFRGVGWSAYAGKNPHKAHCHISIVHNAREDDGSLWNLPMFGSPPIPTHPMVQRKEDTLKWLISDGTQIWLTDGIWRRPATSPTDTLPTIADKLRSIVFMGWCSNSVKADGVPEVPTNAALIADIGVAA